MEEQFISYDLALKLKELGFDEPCMASYLHKSYSLEYIKTEVLYINERFANGQEQIYDGKQILCLAPLWQQAFDWFREKHNLHALNSPLLNNEWSVVIDNTLNSNQVYWCKKLGYQEARQACLEKLIELCENN